MFKIYLTLILFSYSFACFFNELKQNKFAVFSFVLFSVLFIFWSFLKFLMKCFFHSASFHNNWGICSLFYFIPAGFISKLHLFHNANKQGRISNLIGCCFESIANHITHNTVSHDNTIKNMDIFYLFLLIIIWLIKNDVCIGFWTF